VDKRRNSVRKEDERYSIGLSGFGIVDRTETGKGKPGYEETEGNTRGSEIVQSF